MCADSKMRLLAIAGIFALMPAIGPADETASKAAPGRRITALKTIYRGSAAAADALAAGKARPLALASADFDEDGFPDIAAGYEINFSGAVAVHFGSAAKAGTQPFRAAAEAMNTVERPDFLAAGDFNGDDHFDLAVAARGSDRLYFMAGDGKGNFAPAQPIALPGRITAFFSGEVNRADGLADLAVAVSTPEGHRLLVFESPRGALNGEPETVALPAEAMSLSLRLSAKTGFHDIEIQTTEQAYLVRGRDRKLTLPPSRAADAGKAVLEKTTVLGTLATGAASYPAIASLPVHLSGGHAGSRVELHAGSIAPLTSEILFGAAFVVNDPGDAGDGNLTDGICDTGSGTSLTGICTLRAAIQQANYNAVATAITFTNAITTIAPGAMLPEITVPVSVDGLAGRSSRVQLDGRNAVGGDQIYDPSGLGLYGGSSTLTGMTIFGFYTGVKVASANSGGNTIQNNLIGIDNTGAVPSGRQLEIGILLESYTAAGDNLIGGTANGQGNVISTGNANGFGIAIQSPSNTVEGNLIGTDPSGANLIGNGHPIAITDSSNNTIGGTTAGARNVVAGMSGNFCCGNIQITSSNALSSNNAIRGNYVGTDITGTVALGGANGGVYADGADTTIGGTTAAARNVISGNGAWGVTVVRSGALVEGNYIGVNAGGTAALANGIGVQVQVSGATIGGAAGAGNLISGNTGAGVTINQSIVSNAQILGNMIGLNAAGTAPLGNGGDGINVSTISASANTFGAAGSGNVISGNGGSGINSAAGSVTIQGNLIGTNAAGTAAIGNAAHGVAMNASNGSLIGGASQGQGNVISGNAGDGVSVTASANFTVQGNQIGTNGAGTSAMGNGANGILLAGGFIAGTCGSCPDSIGTVKSNTIANNAANGIEVDYGVDLTFRGNAIFANPTAGIAIASGSNNNIQAPVLTSATIGGGMLQVQGSVPNSPAGLPATLELFADNAGDSPFEGRTPLGTVSLNQTGPFNVSIASPSVAVVTSTVTDNGGDTSAFSNAITLQTCVPDVSAKTNVTRGGTRYSAGQKLFLQSDTLTNTGTTALAAPIYVAIDNLSSNATLANAAGTLACDLPASPYVLALSTGTLAPGASLPVQLQFNDPSLAAFTYTTRVLAGAGRP
jgi:parallel beta-helix repeat protein